VGIVVFLILGIVFLIIGIVGLVVVVLLFSHIPSLEKVVYKVVVYTFQNWTTGG